MMELQEVKNQISTNKMFWAGRNTKFKAWYEILTLIDVLAAKGMESYVSNEPQSFYNMAHYLLTKGDLSHITPVITESALELDKQAKLGRGCENMWSKLNRDRKLGGSASFIDDFSFFLLVLGWYATVMYYDKDEGQMYSQIWNPFNVYPSFINSRMYSCVHSYILTEAEAKVKADENNWDYKLAYDYRGNTTLDDFFYLENNQLMNVVLIGGQQVTDHVPRPDMRLLVSPVGGFPDKGSLTHKTKNWKQLSGRGIFEVNAGVTLEFNKWKSMISQIIRDTAQPITQEKSMTPQATTEQLRERGALFHYGSNEGGLSHVPPAQIPTEMTFGLNAMNREKQKGSFNDAVYGMVEGQPGYALGLLASSSANQILYPYMDAKHFVVSEFDHFFLTNIRESSKPYTIKGRLLETIEPKDVPEDLVVIVESEVATQKDWMERGNVAGLLDKHLDETTILTEVLKVSDPQAVIRRKKLDEAMSHPMTKDIELINSYNVQAAYLKLKGDTKQAAIFEQAAMSLKAQFGAPPPGQGAPARASTVQAQRDAGTPDEKPRQDSRVSPPEEQGFTPEQLRQSIGKGTLKAV